jgi:hypothetical protein
LSIHKAAEKGVVPKIVFGLATAVVQNDAYRPHNEKFAPIKQKFADSG